MDNTKQALVVVIALLLAALGCKSLHDVSAQTALISTDKFLEVPFGHDESIASFKQSLPRKTSIRKLARHNKHYPEKTDTIYQFRYRESEVFVYKSYFNREILMAGTVANSKVKLVNGITVGITRGQLYNSIAGIKPTESDTVKISNSDETRNFSFIFRKGKLKKVMFSSYLD
ncbi:MAG: hypothetical protein AB7S54_11770 [Bacteroidales bacterium]